MTLVISYDALRADVYLVILAEVLCLLLRVANTVLLVDFSDFAFFTVLSIQLVVFDLLEEMLGFLGVQTVKDGEVFNKLFHVWTEVCAAGWTGEYVARAQIQQTVLTESVTARKNARNFFLIVVRIVANGTSHLHLNLITKMATNQYSSEDDDDYVPT